MHKANGGSDQPISSGSENEVAEILDTPESVTTIYGVHCKNNDEFGDSSMSVKTHCQLLIGMKNQIFQKIENHEPELEEKCLKKISG